MGVKLCESFITLHSDCNYFYSPGNENVYLTLEFLSDNGTYTCLTISAPSDLLPTSV